MNAPSSPFRSTALERLSSPEQLDRLIWVTRPADWLAVSALALLVFAAALWSVFGVMSSRVSGSGILVAERGDIFSPTAMGDGLVSALLVGPGQEVAVGQRVARIAQPALEAELATARASASEDRAQLGALRAQVEAYGAARSRNDVSQHRLLDQEQTNAGARVQDANDQLAAAQTLMQRGLVTRAHMIELQQQLAAAREAVTEAGSKVVTLATQEINAHNQDARDVAASQARLSEADRRAQDLAAELDRRQWVTSPSAGKLIEIRAPRGSQVETGAPIVTLEGGVGRLSLILYLPPREGKLVKPGMAVNVSPSTARREEFGTMVGRVRSVSDFPATHQAMQATLQNDALVTQFSAAGAPLVVRVSLQSDPGTATGYRWAGGRGPPTPLTSGTIADAQVTVRRQAPIGFVIPLLREKAGL